MTELCKPYDEKMKKTIEVVKADFASVRAGRANAGVLDRIQVEYYGTPTPIQQVASISTPDPRTLAIQPWDASILRAIEKAIQMSDLGINPQNDGRVIRLSFPQLTQERRVELTKQVRKYGGERQGGHPQHPAGRHGRCEEDDQEVRAHRGRPEEPGEGAAGHHRQAVQGDRRAHCGEGKGTHGGVTPPRALPAGRGRAAFFRWDRFCLSRRPHLRGKASAGVVMPGGVDEMALRTGPFPENGRFFQGNEYGEVLPGQYCT